MKRDLYTNEKRPKGEPLPWDSQRDTGLFCGSRLMNMGWLRSVGSIKLWVSFAEYRLFYRALLQKRPIILSILLTKATP